MLVFQSGFRDYIGYPFIAAEIAVRLDCIAAMPSAFGQRSAIATGDPAVEYPFEATIGPTAQDIALVKATCAFLQADIAAHLDLDDLARRMGSNRNSLARAFKQVVGKGAYAWLREQRINTAATKLQATNLSIQQISFDVGYDDANYFSTAFKNMYGMSPRDYRNLVRNSKI